jgi:predicted RNA binding protein YcfA (HicA-like mRNA interferase family)
VTPKLPTAAAKDLVRVAERLGFVFRRQRGSHAIYVRPNDQSRIVIPMHKGELKHKTLRAIIQDLKISLERCCNPFYGGAAQVGSAYHMGAS